MFSFRSIFLIFLKHHHVLPLAEICVLGFVGALLKARANQLFCNMVKEVQSHVLLYIRFLQKCEFYFSVTGFCVSG
jgi:hypothetical protein